MAVAPPSPSPSPFRGGGGGARHVLGLGLKRGREWEKVEEWVGIWKLGMVWRRLSEEFKRFCLFSEWASR